MNMYPDYYSIGLEIKQPGFDPVSKYRTPVEQTVPCLHYRQRAIQKNKRYEVYHQHHYDAE